MLAAVDGRMAEVGLELHPDKTIIVYCKDSNRRGRYGRVSFTFLGYTFRPRQAQGRDGTRFTSFLPAISPDALKRIGAEIRSWRLHRQVGLDGSEIARFINPKVRGWMTYYGAYSRSALYPVLHRINTYLLRWIKKKYKTQYDAVLNDLQQHDDLRVMDFDGRRIFQLFSFQEMGSPVFHEE